MPFGVGHDVAVGRECFRSQILLEEEFERFLELGRQGYLKDRRRQKAKEKLAKRRGEEP